MLYGVTPFGRHSKSMVDVLESIQKDVCVEPCLEWEGGPADAVDAVDAANACRRGG
jgi:hypothetical protein